MINGLNCVLQYKCNQKSLIVNKIMKIFSKNDKITRLEGENDDENQRLVV